MKRNNSKTEAQITSVEEKLFFYLFEYKVATSEQIHRDIYPKYTLRSVNNRLLKLRKCCYVTGSFHIGLGNKVVYHLSKRSYRDYIVPLGYDDKPRLASQAVLHDLDLLEIAHVLKQSQDVESYYSENMIATGKVSETTFGDLSFDGLRPDGIVGVRLKKQPFYLAVEFESARKYQDRYKELFSRYYQNLTIPGILYICKNEALLNAVQAIEKNILDTRVPKFYYSDYSTWKPSTCRSFHNLNGSCITL